MILKFIKASYEKLKKALSKTRSFLGEKIRSLFQGKIDQEMIDQLEQVLYEADLGVQTAQELTQKIQDYHRKNPSLTSEELISVLQKEILALLTPYPTELIDVPKDKGPLVILIVGVNGNGKTTTVAKIAKRFIDSGNKVLIGAADTFRAAATEQLEIWAERIGVPLVKGSPKADPAAVAFDALSAGKARGVDVVIIDTAGRLHTKVNLMQELEKIRRSCGKVISGSPHEVLLVLDATTGQNAIDQAKIFHQFTPLTGIVLTKLDGTAKGGIAISIQRELKIPIKFIGIGESVEDLEPFNADQFVSALFE
jgi:fused signal recognition particle receptor